MIEITLVIIFGFVLDCIFGDPQNPLHPIRIIGAAISWGIRLYKKTAINNKAYSFVFGAVLSIAVIVLSYLATALLITASCNIHIWFGFAVQAVLCYFIIAAKALKVESMKVHKSVVDGDLNGARNNLSRIVGRDTDRLSFPQIIKATVETVAENLSDGVIAPLVFVFIGGVPLGMAYKAVNTLDSMIGYKNETYEYFGKFAARLDDVVNFIPARISAILMIISAMFTGNDSGQALRIFMRDRHNHSSPNSAQTEAVCAGAMGLQLGGDSYYRGMRVRKPTIGDDVNQPCPEHIVAANRMMYVTAVLTIFVMAIVAFVRSFVFE